MLRLMFVRVKSTANSPRKSVQIVASKRLGTKIRQEILRHVGVADDEAELERLKELAQVLVEQMQQEEPGLFLPKALAQSRVPAGARGSRAAAAEPPLKVDLRHLREKRRDILGIHEIYGQVYDELGFGRILSTPSARPGMVGLVKQMVLARLASPLSKRGSVQHLRENFGIELSLPAVYRMMDQLDDKAIERLNHSAFTSASALFGGKINLIFYDCTTLYFESVEEDELRRKGFSKENRFAQTQVVLALAVTSEGIPLGHELYPGNTAEGNTFKVMLESLERKWPLAQLVVVADSAMLSEDNIKLLEKKKLSYIVGGRLKRLKEPLTQQVKDHAGRCRAADAARAADGATVAAEGAEADLVRLGSIPVDQSSRLVISYSPVRARKDAHEREKMIQKLTVKLGKHGRVKGVIGQRGYGRFLSVDKDAALSLNESAIAAAAAWDGLHGVRTNLLNLSEAEVLSQYHGLWQVEDCFRVSKHDLRIRPIYHWTQRRIRAHTALCFMALCCVRHLMYRVKLQQGAMSADAIRRALLSVQASIYEDQKTGQVYQLPGRCLASAEKLYKTMGLKLRVQARRLGPAGR